MIVINPIICEACKKELQPEDIKIGTDEKGNLIRFCGYCNAVETIKEAKE